MPGTTEAIAFTDSYKHMECLGGMRHDHMLHTTGLWTEAQVEVAKLPRDCPTKKSNNHTHTKYQAHPLTKDGIYRS